jgi:hypothetical protein
MKNIFLILFLTFSLQSFSQGNSGSASTTNNLKGEKIINFIKTYRAQGRLGVTQKAYTHIKELNKKGWYVLKMNETTEKISMKKGKPPVTFFFLTIVYEKKMKQK